MKKYKILGTFEIREHVFEEEPASCAKPKCSEQFNALTYFYINFEGFKFSINLCDKHTEKLRNKILKKKESIRRRWFYGKRMDGKRKRIVFTAR